MGYLLEELWLSGISRCSRTAPSHARMGTGEEMGLDHAHRRADRNGPPSRRSDQQGDRSRLMWWESQFGVAVGVLVVWLGLVAALPLVGRKQGDCTLFHGCSAAAARRAPVAPPSRCRYSGDAALVGFVSGSRCWSFTLLFPIDLVPDFIPIVGYADDAPVIVAIALRSVARVARGRRRSTSIGQEHRTDFALSKDSPAWPEAILVRCYLRLSAGEDAGQIGPLSGWRAPFQDLEAASQLGDELGLSRD